VAGAGKWLDRKCADRSRRAQSPDPTTEEAVQACRAPSTGKRGGQPIDSAIAIETGLALHTAGDETGEQGDVGVGNVVVRDPAVAAMSNVS
jgi:hypothetical protein